MAITRTGADHGKLLECAVHLEIRRRSLPVSYWRGKGEVDFVVQSPQGIVPIQISRAPPGERHHRALEEFYEAFPQALEAVLVGPDAYEAGVLERLVQT